jgi:hypothetical protein
MMTRPDDTPRALRIAPRAATLTIGSGEGRVRAQWRGPAPRIRDRRGVTEVGYGVGGYGRS